jgi:uncharacterized protein YbjT (DUF2867 family)
MQRSVQAGTDPDGGKLQRQSYSCLVAGATGLVGSSLLQLLLDDELISEVTVVTRRALPAALASHSRAEKLNMIVTELDQMERVLAGVHADVVYCALGTTIKVAKTREAFRKVDYEYPWLLGQWAKQAGVSQFAIVTAMGAATDSRFFYSRVKGELQEALKKLQLPTLHILQPSLLLGERANVRAGEKMAALAYKVLQGLLTGPLRKYRAITGASVALAMKRAAEAGLAVSRRRVQDGTPQVFYYPSDHLARLADTTDNGERDV